MDLIAYLKKLPDEPAREVFAGRCGTSIGYLRLVGYGHKNPSDSLCIRIQAESRREVTAAEICPDRDWSYLDRLDGEKPRRPTLTLRDRKAA